MRIAFLTDEVLPNHGADTLQFVNALSALARAGVDVSLFLPVPPGSAALRDPGARADLHAALRAHYAAECNFTLVPVPGAFSGPRLLTKVVSGVLTSGRALRGDFDLVHTRTLLPSVATLGRRWPLFFETYRPLTEQFPAVRPVFRALTPLRNFAGLVVHSALVRDRFIADGVPAEKVITLYNGFDAKLLTADRPAPEARAMLGWRERPTLLYAGRIGRPKGCDLFVAAARQMPEVELVFAGHLDTDDARQLQADCAELPNVRFTGFLTGDALALAYQGADVLLVPPSRRPLMELGNTVMPIKLFAYLASGRPVLAGDLPDTTELLRDGDNARLVTPDDVPALIGALRGLLADPDLRTRLAGRARQLAESLTWDARGRRLRAFYEERLAALV
jgi:glycosyltransferase involved in cell wall biosynthesis